MRRNPHSVTAPAAPSSASERTSNVDVTEVGLPTSTPGPRALRSGRCAWQRRRRDPWREHRLALSFLNSVLCQLPRPCNFNSTFEMAGQTRALAVDSSPRLCSSGTEFHSGAETSRSPGLAYYFHNNCYRFT